MAKREKITYPKGKLVIPFEPFYNNPIPIGTECEIVEVESERYVVKFPNTVGRAGTYHIKQHYVELL
jgi:hypothetical protein